eukprot:jgi/Bigna1/87635/estExt_fgenesh1_pg.C_220145
MSDYPSKNEYLEEKQDSTKILPSHLKDLQDLVDRGVLRIWRRSTNQMAPGARGSGHNSKTSSGHVEPEEIYIIGTAHVSDQSAKDVARVIRTVDPDNVVVELCRSRSATLYIDDEGTTEGGDQSANGMRINSLSMSGNNFQAALQRSLKLGGFPALVLRSLMAQTSPESVEIMSKSGVDFRAARRAAEDVGAQIVLGDRPIEITLERAWEAMTWAERKKLIVLILESVQQIKAAGKNEIMDTISTALSDEGKDILQQYEMKLQEYIPNLLLPLITERDIFLSLTMKSSMAVNGCKCVVGVVGRAHLEGVVKALGEDHSGKFKTLTYTRRRAAMKEKIFGVSKPLFQRLTFDAIVLLLSLVVYLQQQH